MVAVKTWAFLFASAACVSAYAVQNEPFKVVRSTSICGTKERLPRQAARRSDLNKASYPRQAGNSSTLIPIDVYMQILSTDGTEEGGNISDEMIDAQLKILDKAFEPVGYRFNLVETIRTINEGWYRNLTAQSPTETEMSLALRKGDNKTLNIYTVGMLNSLDYAWATTPVDLQYYPEIDGVFHNGTVFLGGNDPVYDKGILLVHEVGHWFGLHHIFGYSCDMSYDYVSDTPMELIPDGFGGCPIGRDSCPDQPGLDSVRNYMSYSSDDCKNTWTPGQIQRMREQMAKWRRVMYPGIDADNIPEDNMFTTPPYIGP